VLLDEASERARGIVNRLAATRGFSCTKDPAHVYKRRIEKRHNRYRLVRRTS
jgi:hypothetical protein